MYARAGSAIPWPLHGYSIFSSTPARALPRLRCPFQAEIPEKRGKSPPARTTAQRMQSLACCRVHGRCVHATARQMRGHHGAALGHQAWRRIVWAETAAGTLRKPPPRASLSTQRTAAFWMGSFSAIGSARTASDRSSSNLAFWTTTRTGHPTQWRTELVLPVPCLPRHSNQLDLRGWQSKAYQVPRQSFQCNERHWQDIMHCLARHHPSEFEVTTRH
jgi:hypothetical protein